MTNQITISAKNLGELALPSFCPRCFWLKLRLNNKLPFQIFPGIFSSIDSYTKTIVHSWFDRHNTSPIWLNGIGELSSYVNPPHWSKYNIVDYENNILLRGVPDGIFLRPDNSYVIADYKTAKYTGAQDRLLPMYQVQLNAYALIGEQNGFKPVSNLALIYMEPVTDRDVLDFDIHYRDDGFLMGFRANVLGIPVNLASISPLLVKVREIYEMDTPPVGCLGCKDCQALENLLYLSRGQ
jgi:hypothetical protein